MISRSASLSSGSTIIWGMNCRLVFGLALALGLALPLSAQTPDSVSLDISAGPSYGSSSREKYYQPGSAAAEFMIATGPTHTTGRVYGLTVGGTASYSSTDVCAIDETRPGQCRAFFPSTLHIGVLGGFHLGGSRAALRAMVGPVAFSGGGVSGGGGLLQVDGAAGFSHVAFLIGLRGQLLRRGNGENLYIRSLGLGLRLQ